eukprot:TRINITY_DN18498_c0_g1_i1.p1 TRINITY_DN18498_c0_g1~~TRINITY_DN18498_c0_g1_i1.p1  ORF type:complete len:577 (-),score=97.25 TRINITY_DN18498_c0_g1_i1:172-1815(-)
MPHTQLQLWRKVHKLVFLAACLLADVSVLTVLARVDLQQDELVAGDECEPATEEPGCALSALQFRGVEAGAGEVDRRNASSQLNLVEAGPPRTAMGYKGMAWPDMRVTESAHVFLIGDWGGLDGSLSEVPGMLDLVKYPSGKGPGPHVMPRTRWDKDHTRVICNDGQFLDCFKGHFCSSRCGFVREIDTKPQQLVANAFNARAEISKPQYVLNVGDNFYWGGIETNCGSPMNRISPVTQHQFDRVFEEVYDGAALKGIPWISVLGNHDWGGYLYRNGWDQQIAYTWASDRWVMPAPYYSQRVNYPDQDFTMDYFMIDTNFLDAKQPTQWTLFSNVCSWFNDHTERIKGGSKDCSAAGGPRSAQSCPAWFASFWKEQQAWLEQKLSTSEADWQVIVTHFPCGHMAKYYKRLNEEFGLDLLLTGHRHDQEIWPSGGKLGGLTCLVSGGGGGITSEASPERNETWTEWGYGAHVQAQYGFFDLTVSKAKVFIESINYKGEVVATSVVVPSHPPSSEPTAIPTVPAGMTAANSTSPEVNSTTISPKDEQPR